MQLKRKKAFNVLIANKSRHVNLEVFNVSSEPDNSNLFIENADKCAKCKRPSTEWKLYLRKVTLPAFNIILCLSLSNIL